MTNKKILVADDSLTIQKVIRLALSNEGYEIQAISDGNDALEQLSLFRPDLILIDLSLPNKSAIEVKEEVSQISDLDDTRFVLMSSAFEEVNEAHLEKAKFDGRLVKPFDPADLRKVINQVLEAQSLSSSISVPAPPNIDITPEPKSNFQPQSMTVEPPHHPEHEPRNSEFAEESETDIRELTESTIKMSGLDDFQWSINEKAALKTSHPSDLGKSESRAEVLGDITLSNLSREEPQLSTGENLTDGPNFSFSESSDTVEPAQVYREAPDFQEGTRTDTGIKSIEHSEIENHAQPISMEDMEALVSRQIGKTLEAMARDLFPKIAEKVIKSEIDRLLADPPSPNSADAKDSSSSRFFNP
jgi:two-component system, cell cycle response regulator